MHFLLFVQFALSLLGRLMLEVEGWSEQPDSIKAVTVVQTHTDLHIFLLLFPPLVSLR